MHVFGIDDCARIKKKLNTLFGSKGGGSMKRRFTLRSAVAHEAICFDIGRRRAIRIGTVRQSTLRTRGTRKVASDRETPLHLGRDFLQATSGIRLWRAGIACH